jgi:hypothetical protein
VRSSIAGLLRLASLVICLIVIASFAIFAVNQASSASTRQQTEIANGGPASTSPGAPAAPKARAHESAIHEAIDEASKTLTAPFSGIVSGSGSEWRSHIEILLLALVVYGFGLGFVARMIGVRL